MWHHRSMIRQARDLRASLLAGGLAWLLTVATAVPVALCGEVARPRCSCDGRACCARTARTSCCLRDGSGACGYRRAPRVPGVPAHRAGLAQPLVILEDLPRIEAPRSIAAGLLDQGDRRLDLVLAPPTPPPRGLLA
jgi:hypothetical protein